MIIDLSHTIKTKMSIYPGTPPPEIVDLGLRDKYGVNVQQLTLTGHVGTHIDTPAHIYDDADTTSTMDISNFFGPGQILDCSEYKTSKIIDIKVLEQLDHENLPEFILLNTGWDDTWGSDKYSKSFPTPSEELISALAKTDIKGVGIDTFSIDSIDAHHFPNHKKILGSDKIIVENLKNLQHLIKKRFLFSCLPLKISRGDGSPVRAVGLIDA
ncbi:MAG: cyclase family protein [Desulfobacteraceae bacterium]|nr:cyclase family protein [Desulfobacteraceae bacterium]